MWFFTRIITSVWGVLVKISIDDQAEGLVHHMYCVLHVLMTVTTTTTADSTDDFSCISRQFVCHRSGAKKKIASWMNGAVLSKSLSNAGGLQKVLLNSLDRQDRQVL